MTKFYIYIAIINFLDVLAVVSGKMWIITRNPLYIVGTALGFGLAGFFFALSLQYEGMAVTNVLWIAISVILVAILGHYMFKETIGAWQLVGMALVLVGIVFLNIRQT